jgi:hypothetical protein
MSQHKRTLKKKSVVFQTSQVRCCVQVYKLLAVEGNRLLWFVSCTNRPVPDFFHSSLLYEFSIKGDLVNGIRHGQQQYGAQDNGDEK